MSSSAVGYRPPNWGSKPQLYSITCTLPANTSNSGNSNTGSTSQAAQATTYFFDATLRVDHTQEAVGTEHPVQVGTAIIDHIYLRAPRVVLEIGISDAMQSYSSGQYSGGSSRSVSAYQTFKQIQAARVPITLATRLDSYQNMWVEVTRATETSATFSSLRAILSFRQILSAQVASSTVSSRPDTTNSTPEGTKAPENVSPDVQQYLDELNSGGLSAGSSSGP